MVSAGTSRAGYARAPRGRSGPPPPAPVAAYARCYRRPEWLEQWQQENEAEPAGRPIVGRSALRPAEVRRLRLVDHHPAKPAVKGARVGAGVPVQRERELAE